MDIVIVAQYLRDLESFDGNNSRFLYIAKMLAKSNKNNIEIITSDFSHARKTNFNKIDKIDGIKFTVCHETGYERNVSLKRFISHKELAINIKKYLKDRKKPDVIYLAVPSLSVGKICTKFCDKNDIKLIIDIQDLWPEAFKMVFNIPIISNLIFFPMKKQADYIYSRADEIVAVSETYCNRALKVNKKTKKGLSVFLGTDLKYFDECKKNNKIEFDDDVIRIAYIGTLGHSYNIKFVIDAISILNKKGINNIKFIVMGDGPLKQEFEEYAKERNINCEFTGKLKYENMIGLLCSCDIAVNPIKAKSAGSIINKVGDYAAAGLPVINSQESKEYRYLIDENQIGINVENDDSNSMSSAIELMCSDYKKRKEYGNNNRKLAEKKFDRQNTYSKIINVICK
jgi:hypothetical protein